MGRIPTGKTPQHALKLLRGKHRDIMRRLIAGESQASIAKALGMTQTRISIIKNSPLFIREMERLEGEVEERFVHKKADIDEEINEGQMDAVKVLKNIMRESNVDGKVVTLTLKKEAALDILELGGNGKRAKGGNGDGNGVQDAIAVIKEGFKLAQSAYKDRINSQDMHEYSDERGIVDITPEEMEINETEKTASEENLSPEDIGIDLNKVEKTASEELKESCTALVQI